MSRFYWVPLVATLTCGTASAQTPGVSPMASSFPGIEQGTIAGVAYGDTQENAIKALKAAGWEVEELSKAFSYNYTFSELVKQEASRRQDKSYAPSGPKFAASLKAKKGVEEIAIDFYPMPYGNAVSEITYSHRGIAGTKEAFEAFGASARGKYAQTALRPAKGNNDVFCVAKDPTCFKYGWASLPHIIIGDYNVWLRGGKAYFRYTFEMEVAKASKSINTSF